jgi:predicted alpha/beta-hydrolase family hydrolase
MTEFFWTKPLTETIGTLLLAHGAGAAMDSSFMNRFAEAAARHGIQTARFEFPYMAARREGGKKAPPPRADLLIVDYEQAVLQLLEEVDGPILVGGKSMGGRVATIYCGGDALPARVAGVICLGYPFHPTGKPDDWRLAPLEACRLPVLILQGDRDPFGSREEVDARILPETVEISWLEDGNHDFGPRGRSPATWDGNIDGAAAAVAAFARQPKL